MSLDRTLTLWLARQSAEGCPDVVSPVLDSSLRWVGRKPEQVAARLREHLQGSLWEPGAEGALEQLPAVLAEVGEPVTITLPARRDGLPRLALEVAVLMVTPSAEHAVLAVAPSLGLSWAGANREQAVSGLREAIRLDLLARDPPMDGAAIATLAASSGGQLTVHPLPIALSFPTFSEVREHEKKGEAKAGDFLEPVTPGECWCMEAELDALARVIQSGRSVVLVGPRGVGKSAMIKQLVKSRWSACRPGTSGRLLEAHAPTFLVKLLANGSWQDDLARLCTRLGESGDWLYVTSLPELFEVGRYEGNNTSCGEFVRPWLGRGELRLVSECTAEEIATLDARYPGALNGVVRVPVPEPTDRLELILEAWNQKHEARFTTSALRESLRLHRRFAPYSGFPGRILRFLDAVRLESTREDGGAGRLDRDAVYASFCAQTGLLQALIDPRFPLPYAQIEGFFEARVYGQPAAGAAVTAAIASVKADVSPWGKPLASMLLVGPTGVGKTETARALAEFLFGAADRMIRFDMSEFQTPGSVVRLIEGPEGEGLLTSAVRRQPFCVLLLDELEKAHPAVLDLLLQVLGEGRLTDGRGRLTDFCACVVLMTSNVGAMDARRNTAGFGGSGGAAEAGRVALAEKAARYRDAVKGWLRPEMLNRIDHVLPFDPLSADAIGRVLDRELDALCKRPGLAEVPLTLSTGARESLVRLGYDPAWGARQLQRAVQDQLVAPIALKLFDGTTGSPSVSVDVASVGKLSVAVTREGGRPGLRPLDWLYDRMVNLRARCRNALDGPSFAELEATLAVEERRGAASGRARRAAIAASGRSSSARETHDGLLRLRGEVALAEQEVGVRALLDEGRFNRGEPPNDELVAGHRARLEGLERRFSAICRSLAELTIPDIGALVVGLYGDVEGVPLRSLAAMYERVATQCGSTVEVGRVHPTLAKNGVFTAVFPLRTVGGKVDPKPSPVGLELVVLGPAAAWLFQGEAGIHAFAPGFIGPALGAASPGPALAKEVRVSVQTWPVQFAEFVKTRPDDLNRRLRFEGPADRHISIDKVQGTRSRFRLPDFSHLDAWLARGFDSKVLGELS